jgi:hypothetical protein
LKTPRGSAVRDVEMTDRFVEALSFELKDIEAWVPEIHG